MKTYFGLRKPEGVEVRVTEDKTTRLLDIGPSQKVLNHSAAYEVGYGGSGPAQTALAILLDHTGKEDTAVHYHQDFKWAFVSGWEDTWRITGEEIDKWLQGQRQEATARPKTATPVKIGYKITGVDSDRIMPPGTSPGSIQG